MRSTLRVVFLCLIFIAAPLRGAPITLQATKLDPNIARAIETGLTGSFHRGAPGHAKVLVELTSVATDALLDVLSQAGVQLVRVAGKRLSYDRFVPGVVDAESLAQLGAMADVRRVSLASDAGPPPLDRSAQILRLADARGAHPDVGGLTGKGMVIADIDTMVDIFQPTFFKGDGGYYDWIDVDADGVFTPGKDAVDLDKNGALTAGEIALAIPVTTINERNAPVPAARPAGFDPGIDWLYLDSNGNGKRDYGMAGGFDDTAPALGEPLFTPDDANRNGKLDVGERVVRLGTSKFKKIYISLTSPIAVSSLFERGSSLSQATVDVTGGQAYGFPDSLHGTGVSTILVGDLPLAGRRWVGMAPDADVLLAFDISGNIPVDGTTWALGEKPDVMLHEIAAWTGAPLDGSDALSSLIDASVTNDHVTQTCPTGDQGSARKHARAQIAAGASAAMSFDLQAHAIFGTRPYSYVDLSINTRGGVPKNITLVGPKGDAYDITASPQATIASGPGYYATTQLTSRGTSFTDIVMYVQTGAFDVGTWKLQITGDAVHAITVDGFVSDDESSFGLGVAWVAAIASNASTIGLPSTADHCISINAQPDHLGSAAEPWFAVPYADYDVPTSYADKEGQIRAYTPRGPRIDGVTKPDVTAPDNPWVAAESLPTSTQPYGSFRVFGGTSGSSPHATGVGALLAQVGIRGDDARNAMRMGAVVDGITGTVPNSDYGYGRLDAAAALGIKTVGKDFTIALTSDPVACHVGQDCRLVVTGQGDADALAGLQSEWDDGYDGTYDVAFAGSLSHAISAPTMMPGKFPYKVRVRNGAGHVAEAVLWVDFARPSGCGCFVGGSTPPMPIAIVLGLGALFFAVRRRRAPRHRH